MNKLLALGGMIVIALGFFLLVLPVSHIPLLDANRQVLAETEAAGYCAGQTYMQSGGRGDVAAMADCAASNPRDANVDYSRVIPAFCLGVISGGMPISQADCLGELTGRQLWPTAKGSLTDSWNKRFPFPGDILSANQPTTGDVGRTGDRVDNEREGNTR